MRRPAARLLADPEFIERFRPRVVSTTLAVARVAAGRRAAYVTDGHLRDSVHFAAGIALCRAAGCVVTGLDGRPPHTGAGGLVVAADRETHAALLELIDDQLPSGDRFPRDGSPENARRLRAAVDRLEHGGGTGEPLTK
ncbi:inositol monophosphatase family protein [Planomonospora corallina]|uniref:Inositol monophosphatase family protein n=1 Tax=Planomonospora corallina TaxID=1806052 RepID=A0ABV8I506_9ACTN